MSDVQHSDSATVVGPNSKISLALLAGIFCVSSAALVGGTRWATRVETRLERIEENLAGVGVDRWTESDMRSWARELDSANATLEVPEPVHRFVKDTKK